MQAKESVVNAEVTLVEIQDVSVATILPGMVGSIGESTNPLSDELLSELSAAFADGNPIATFGDVTAAIRGEIKEFSALQHEVKAESHAEMILKMATGRDGFLTVDGVREVFSRVNYSDISFALATKTSLFVAKDGGRLYVIDLRPQIGQIVFVPSPDQARSVLNAPKYAALTEGLVYIEVPDSQMWCFDWIDDRIACRKFKVTKTKYFDFSQDQVK